jgi:HK97 family phage prohead protease
MKLWVDEKGINISADLDTENNSRAQELYSAIERGDMSGMSFCFYVREDGQKWNDDFTRREILKVDKVVEVSAVNMPAYDATTIDSRSLDSDKRALESARKALENAVEVKAKPVDYRLKTILNIYNNK